MKKSTTHFAVMSDRAYTGAMTRYGNLKNLSEIRQDFDNYAYNSLIRYADTGDTTHITRVLIAAKEIGRFRLFRNIFKKLVAHSWHSGTNSLPDRRSKANKKKLSALKATGAARFLVEFQDAETKKQKSAETKTDSATTKTNPTKSSPKKSTTTKEWDFDSALAAFIEDVESHNGNLDQIVEKVVNLQKSRDKQVELQQVA